MLNQAPMQPLVHRKCCSVLTDSHSGKFLDFCASSLIYYCPTYTRCPCDKVVYILLNCTVFFANVMKEIFENTNVTEHI